MKKYLIFLIAGLSFWQFSWGQIRLERQLIGAAGQLSNQGSLSLSSSLGESIVTFESSGSISLSQGFQQADGLTVGLDAPLLSLKYEVFPNPTFGKIFISIQPEGPLMLGLEVFDLHGKACGIRVESMMIQGQHTVELDLSSLSAAPYLLLLKQDQHIRKAIRIQKID